MISVTWYEAAQYCRWLSEREGIEKEQCCYPSVADIEKSKDGLTPLKLPPNFVERTGYRLPTEAEWEYACRADTSTTRFYGSDSSLLAHYAWYWNNSEDQAWPVGQKQPNDLGLFDMHGNIWSWCHAAGLDDLNAERGRIAEDRGHRTDLQDPLGRVLRGGSFFDHAHNVRAASRNPYRPPNPFTSVGLRLARTCRK
jgi:formylglycine-generating enzyme required for sulfatase activity